MGMEMRIGWWLVGCDLGKGGAGRERASGQDRAGQDRANCRRCMYTRPDLFCRPATRGYIDGGRDGAGGLEMPLFLFLLSAAAHGQKAARSSGVS